jgi:hypothetical protein
MEHSTDPLPFAGETVIHGDSVIATQLPDELTLIAAVPPPGPILILSVSTPNSISGSGPIHDDAKAASIENIIILFQFIVFLLLNLFKDSHSS